MFMLFFFRTLTTVTAHFVSYIDVFYCLVISIIAVVEQDILYTLQYTRLLHGDPSVSR